MKITAESVKAAEKVLADSGIEAGEAQTVLRAVGRALMGAELYPDGGYGTLDWLAAAAKASDEACDYVERIWNAYLREDELESFRDYWVVDGKVRVFYESGPGEIDSILRWTEYPASLFASERDAEGRAAEWRRRKDANEQAAFEAHMREHEENVRKSELAELKRLLEKYGAEGASAQPAAGAPAR